MTLEHGELTGQIIGSAMAVHRSLGPGFLETAYENAIAIELAARGITFDQQHVVRVEYRAREVATHRLDLLVERIIIVELKAVRALEPIHTAVCRSYLRATGLRHALLINFAREELEFRRVMASTAA